MKVEFRPEMDRIKNGYSARCSELRIRAHGYSPAIAVMNLERTVQLFLRPFWRDFTLKEELAAAGFAFTDDGSCDVEVKALEELGR